MPLTLDEPPPAAPLSRGPWDDLLTRIAEETELDGSVRVAGKLLPVPRNCRLAVAALADALHARYVRPGAAPYTARPFRAGGSACARLAAALHPEFLGRDGWTFTYRSESGVPVLVLTSGGGPGRTQARRARASCFLDLNPGIAPEAFALLVTTLDGHGLGLRAELRGDPAFPERVGAAVITVARSDAAAVVRVALRMRERSPLAVGGSVAAFTRELAPGIGLADEPEGGPDLGRHRCRLIAAALLAAGSGAGPAARRDAVLRTLVDAGLDPAALHLNPGSPEFRLDR